MFWTKKLLLLFFGKRNWTHKELTAFRFIPESVRWYRVNNKLEKAEQVLRRIAKINKKQWPNNVKILGLKNQQNVQTTIKDVFLPWKMGVYTLIQCFGWYVDCYILCYSQIDVKVLSPRWKSEIFYSSRLCSWILQRIQFTVEAILGRTN